MWASSDYESKKRGLAYMFPSQPLERVNLTSILILKSLSPELGKNKFLSFELPTCGTLLQQSQQICVVSFEENVWLCF
jgi:hypothetical protein